MLYFLSDYTEGCHPKVLEALAESNLISQPGYGGDLWCRRAADRIRELCGTDADVHFLTGGTQANLVVISSLLRRHEAVIAAATGHSRFINRKLSPPFGYPDLPVFTDPLFVQKSRIQSRQSHCTHLLRPLIISSPSWRAAHSARHESYQHILCNPFLPLP